MDPRECDSSKEPINISHFHVSSIMLPTTIVASNLSLPISYEGVPWFSFMHLHVH